jgi:hypothetical protein
MSIKGHTHFFCAFCVEKAPQAHPAVKNFPSPFPLTIKNECLPLQALNSDCSNTGTIQIVKT